MKQLDLKNVTILPEECLVCKNNQFMKVSDCLYDSKNHAVYQCTTCGHRQIYPLPTESDNKIFYDQNKQDINVGKAIDLKRLAENAKVDNNRRADLIQEKFPGKESILDVGSGYGFFLEEMKKRGFDVAGVEISEERRNLSRQITDCEIYSIDLTKTIEGLRKYSIITLFHVIEHLIEPVKFCQSVYGILEDDGVFILELPNAEELMVDACLAYRKWYWKRAHLSYFNSQDISSILNQAGFSKVDVHFVQRYGIDNLFNWLTTGKPQLEKPVFYTIDVYKWLEDYFRKYLEESGRSDTMFVFAYRK